MKLVEFDYTKANGKQSERAVVVLQEPTHLLSGFDVTELESTELADFLQEYRELKNRQYEELQQVIQKHDLKHNYRQFKPENMQIKETSWV